MFQVTSYYLDNFLQISIKFFYAFTLKKTYERKLAFEGKKLLKYGAIDC